MNKAALAGSAARLQIGFGLSCLAMLLLLAAGCALPSVWRHPKRVAIRSLELTNASGQRVTRDVLALEVMRFADDYSARVAQAVDDFIAKTTTPEARIEAVRWKLSQGTAAVIDATGPNPLLNLLDLLVLANLSRMVVEDQISPMFGPDAQPLVETHRRLELIAWVAASQVLKPEQQQELKATIREWHKKNPSQRYIAVVRFRELASVAGKAPEQGASPSSLLGLLYLDPFAGLDPTAEAIQETRRMAERAMFYTQRMPTLLSWQAQLLSLQLAAQPEARQVLGDAERLTRSAETFARVADQLPSVVNDQREAAIQQILNGLAAERTNWLVSLASEQQTARTLLSEARQTLDAGSEMATSVNAAIRSLDDFVRFVTPAKTNRVHAATNSRPFNVLDYGAAASQIGVASEDLNRLLLTLNQSAPDVSRQLAQDITQVLHRAFGLGVAFIIILLAGLVLAGLAYRALARKLMPDLPARPRSNHETQI